MLPLSLAGVVDSARAVLDSNGVAAAARAADWMNFRRVMVKTLPQMARICTNFQSVLISEICVLNHASFIAISSSKISRTVRA